LAKSKELGDQAKEAGEDSGPFLQRIKTSALGALSFVKAKASNIGGSLSNLSSETGEITTAKSTTPLYSWWANLSSKFNNIPFIRSLVDWWVNLKLWSSEKLYLRYLMPTLGLVFLVFFIFSSILYFTSARKVSKVKKIVVSETKENLLNERIGIYQNYVRERSDEIEKIVNDNTTKTSLIAESPTFQELNIQGMEAFSRNLLRKDSNILDVVVLTHPEVKANIRTRRIGEKTDFIFTCCETPSEREVTYEEISEKDWLVEIDSSKSLRSDIYINPVNNEKYFYQANNIADVKNTQNGAVLLRYNLNFAIENLKSSNLSGINFLVSQDTVVMASSVDSLFPKIETLSMLEAAEAGPIDYFVRIIEIIQKSKTPEQALGKLTDAKFIRDKGLFEKKFGEIIPGALSKEPSLDSLGEGTWLSDEQALAILDLSFAELLQLKGFKQDSLLTPDQKTAATGRDLAMLYLDSIKISKNGYILDDDFLLTYTTNKYGWTLINQTVKSDFMAPIDQRAALLGGHFSDISSSLFWMFLLTFLFFLTLFLLFMTGIIDRITKPVRQLATFVDEQNKGIGQGPKLENTDEITFLGTRFRTLNNELRNYVNKLESSNKELEQYAYVVSHDLRAPVRMVNSYTQLLSKKMGDKLDDKGKTYIDFIQEGSKRMDDMIKQLLSYATLSKKLDKETYNEVDLSSQVKMAMANLSQKIETVAPTIELGNLPTVKFRGSSLVTVFQNLLDNAIKYKQKDEALKIEINANELKDFWQVAVKDNGKGIDLEEKEKVFEMFFRAGNEKDSIGIGLASCKRIIEHGGGSILVDSLGKNLGCTFFINLPKHVNGAAEGKVFEQPLPYYSTNGKNNGTSDDHSVANGSTEFQNGGVESMVGQSKHQEKLSVVMSGSSEEE